MFDEVGVQWKMIEPLPMLHSHVLAPRLSSAAPRVASPPTALDIPLKSDISHSLIFIQQPRVTDPIHARRTNVGNY